VATILDVRLFEKVKFVKIDSDNGELGAKNQQLLLNTNKIVFFFFHVRPFAFIIFIILLFIKKISMKDSSYIAKRIS